MGKETKEGAAALGWDPEKGWGPGLGVNSLPGAPGANDAAIFANRKPLSGQQFDKEDPYEADLANQMEAKPTTPEDYSIAQHMEGQRQASLGMPLTKQQARWLDPESYGSKRD